MTRVFVLLALVAAANALDWESWKGKYGKSYLGRGEEVLRKRVWESNLQIVQQHNVLADQGQANYRLGMNAYADLYNEEFMALKGSSGILQAKDQSSTQTFKPLVGVTLPSSVDWRNQGYVTPVKDQGQCGSCWSFSATGSLEGQHFAKTGTLVSLSEQQLVDCSWSYGNYGCSGGLMESAYDYIRDAGGVQLESAYPYTAQNGRCHFDQSKAVATCTGHVAIPSGDEQSLMQAVGTVGPVAVAIDASGYDFQLYESGVYDRSRCSSSSLDHGVLAAGYGTEGGNDYWLVKNSWGPGWGAQGYIKMSRNKSNQCGIATMACYPLV
uniref:cathepsin L-like n=1 Tax=Myxine glutinosa TaxID=7769 RepID=UPI00358F86F8